MPIPPLNTQVKCYSKTLVPNQTGDQVSVQFQMQQTPTPPAGVSSITINTIILLADNTFEVGANYTLSLTGPVL